LNPLENPTEIHVQDLYQLNSLYPLTDKWDAVTC